MAGISRPVPRGGAEEYTEQGGYMEAHKLERKHTPDLEAARTKEENRKGGKTKKR